MVMPDSDANWAKLCKALGREDLTSVSKSSSIESRRENAVEIIAELDRIIGAKTLEELAPHMDANDVIYAPMRNLLEALSDPQVEANDMLRTLEHPNHGPYQILNMPMHFGRSEVGPKAAAPEVGQHTEEVLLELGYDWGQINRLQDEGVTPSG
jgi:crotonobetainyl-CoA:carnitine CoA-transferase CaiB-like acyl-CoA transferase